MKINIVIRKLWFTTLGIYTFSHLKRPFLYSENYIKIIYYITLMNNEELIKENILLKEELEKTKMN